MKQNGRHGCHGYDIEFMNVNARPANKHASEWDIGAKMRDEYRTLTLRERWIDGDRYFK